jgi:hypothetical protein
VQIKPKEIIKMSSVFVESKSRKEVVAAYPDAAKIVKVCGGYKVFETIADYETWKNQK